MLSKDKIKKIVQINNYFFRLFNRRGYITFLGLSDDEQKDYLNALCKNNILKDDGLFVLSYQNVWNIFNDMRVFESDYNNFKVNVLGSEFLK